MPQIDAVARTAEAAEVPSVVVPIQLLEDLVREQPFIHDECGYCEWCEKGVPREDWVATADPKYHEADCPWLAARALLDGVDRAAKAALPQIRIAVEDDAKDVVALNGIVQAIHYENRPDWLKPVDPDGVDQVVKRWLLSDNAVLFVAEQDCSLVGYAVGISHERADHALVFGASFVELDQIVVLPSVRRQGVGRALVERVVEWAQELGAKRVELSTWEFNEEAHRLFEALGFVHIVRRMSKPLP